MSSLSQILYTLSYVALPLILAIVLHEYAHGWVANRFGDPTARMEGRLTLNPSKTRPMMPHDWSWKRCGRGPRRAAKFVTSSSNSRTFRHSVGQPRSTPAAPWAEKCWSCK